MRINKNTKLCGQRVVLVPYEPQHVPKYHEWMKSPVLRELTASEPLTLEQEYEMQRSWRVEDDKLTFIVLDAAHYAEHNDEIAAMVGDTNLFLSCDDTEQHVAEAEIMIAEHKARGKGYGREAMLLMFKYAYTNQLTDKFEVKIDMNNEISIRMFKSFQFEEVRRVEVFNEVTLQRIITADWLAWLDKQVQLKMEPYR